MFSGAHLHQMCAVTLVSAGRWDPYEAAGITHVPFKVEVEPVSWEGSCVSVSRKEMWPLAEQLANDKSP